jgi:8-oxo-dGTP pyrophosphatase MutT (NUDIX family)
MAQEQLFHIGVKWLIRNKDWLYLCVKSSQWFFDIPGGRISENEDWEFTLFRELREELCVPSDAYIVSSEPIPLHTNRFTQKEPRSVKLFILIYHCELKDDISILLNEENTDYSWETARDLYEKVDILQSVPLETLFT